jgi:hypothetical protein
MKKSLRFLGILFMGITAAVTLLSGVGTTCVALDPASYDSMKAIAQFQWLYILYVVVGVAIGILGIQATIKLVKGDQNAEKSVLLALILGIVTGGVHMITSRALRGSSLPLDYIVYITIFTLLIFLLFRLPKLRELALFEKGTVDESGAAGGLTAIVVGLLFLSVQMWAGPTHLLDGVNYADAFHNAMLFIGGLIILIGIGLISKSVLFQRTPASLEQIIS